MRQVLPYLLFASLAFGAGPAAAQGGPDMPGPEAPELMPDGPAPLPDGRELMPDDHPPIDEEILSPDAEAIVPPVDDVPPAHQAETDRIDDLFAELKREPNGSAAKRIADNIWGEWFRSGSPTVDLMLHWSNEAVKKKQYNIALDFLDQVILQKPDYAEGFNRRATLHFNMDNYAKSMNDIYKVLEIEPRHFGALSGMAIILERTGKNEAALNAWQRVLEIYPAMEAAQDAIVRISETMGGDPV